MQTTSSPQSISKPTFLLAVFVLLSCGGLFWLDHETRSIGDLFKIGNLVALLVYFVPTFLVTFLFYLVLSKKNKNRKSLTLSLVIGIPLSFALIIFAFYLRN